MLEDRLGTLVREIRRKNTARFADEVRRVSSKVKPECGDEAASSAALWEPPILPPGKVTAPKQDYKQKGGGMVKLGHFRETIARFTCESKPVLAKMLAGVGASGVAALKHEAKSAAQFAHVNVMKLVGNVVTPLNGALQMTGECVAVDASLCLLRSETSCGVAFSCSDPFMSFPL